MRLTLTAPRPEPEVTSRRPPCTTHVDGHAAGGAPHTADVRGDVARAHGGGASASDWKLCEQRRPASGQCEVSGHCRSSRATALRSVDLLA